MASTGSTMGTPSRRNTIESIAVSQHSKTYDGKLAATRDAVEAHGGNPQNVGTFGGAGLFRDRRASAPYSLLSKGRTPPRPRQHIPNSRHRWTEYLSAPLAMDLIKAAIHASKIGRPLNLFVTLHFERANLLPTYRAQDAIGAWLKRAGQWLGLRAIPNTFVWVIEHAPGTGEHVHILMHCPHEHRKAFRAKAEKDWMCGAGMVPAKGDKGAIHIVRIGPRSYDHGTATRAEHGTYNRQLKGILRYHLKGIDPDSKMALIAGKNAPFVEMFGIDPEYSVPIYGRRASRSQNIGPTARAKYHAQHSAEAKKIGLAGGVR